MIAAGPLQRLLLLAGWNAAGWVALAVWVLLSSGLIFRWLGAADLGIWATIGSLRALFALVEGGLAAVATREGARLRGSPDSAAAHLGATRWLYVGFGVATLSVGVLAADLPGQLMGLSGSDAEAARAITLLLAVEAALALATGYVPALVGTRERFDVLAIAAVAQVAVSFLLFLALVGPAGIVAAAIATLGGRIVWVSGLWLWLRSSAADLLRIARPGRPAFRSVFAVAGPLWLGALSSQLAIRTDVPIVAAFFGPVAASHFALGAGPPLIAVGLLFVIIDVVYPRLAARAAERQRQDLSPLLPVSAGLGMLGFVALIAASPTVLEAWVGEIPPLTVTVMVVYSLTWIANVPAHVLVLIATAAGRNLWLAPVVIVEAFLNLALSIGLAAGGLAAGPAVATLLTLAVADLIVIPAVLLPRLGLRIRDFARGSLLGYAVGLAAAVPVLAVLSLAGGAPAVVRLLLTTAATGVAGFVVLAAVYAVLDHRSQIAGWATDARWVLRHGGWWVWLRQRWEVRRARARLARSRAAAPRRAEPLVSVRIATRDRGDLVVHRAIRSALAQSFRNIEVIVVGDDWDDPTERAVRSVTDPRVRSENLSGPLRYPAEPLARWLVAGSAAMNRGVALARGEWIAPLDDDDEFTPDHIEVLLDACLSRDLDLAYGIAEMEVEPGRWERVGSWPLRQGQIVHASVLYSARLRSIVHDPQVWRLKQPGDWNLWSRMRDAGARIGFVDRVVCRHYVEKRQLRTVAT